MTRMGDKGGDHRFFGGRYVKRREINIGTELQEVGWWCKEWIALVQDKDRWRFLVNAVINLVEIIKKMQLCIIIYYSTVHWRLNMFRAAYRSSSGTLTVFAASGLHTHVVNGRSQVWVGTVPTQTWLRSVTTCVHKPEAANTVRAPDDERYATRNMMSLQWTVE